MIKVECEVIVRDSDFHHVVNSSDRYFTNSLTLMKQSWGISKVLAKYPSSLALLVGPLINCFDYLNGQLQLVFVALLPEAEFH